jgi:hypothetical protein
MEDCNVIEDNSRLYTLDRLVTTYNLVFSAHNGNAIEDGYWFWIDKSQFTSYNSQLVTISVMTHESKFPMIQNDFGV